MHKSGHNIIDSFFSIEYTGGQPKQSFSAVDKEACQLVFYMSKTPSLAENNISLVGTLDEGFTNKNGGIPLHFPVLILTVHRAAYTEYLNTIGMGNEFSFPELDSHLHILTKEQSENFTFHFKRLFLWYQTDNQPSQLLKYSWLYEILLMIGEVFRNTDAQVFSPEQNNQNSTDLISRIVAYIQENYMESLSVDSISDYFYVSKYHLMREFKKNTGFTIHTFILNERIAKAQDMISHGITAGTASDMVGFSDYSLFYRAFLKVTGVTPKEFGLSLAAALI